MDSKNTLSNVDNPEGVIVPPCAETMIGTIPEAKSSLTGVSVRYVPQSNFQWFALRASYGREDKAADFLIEDGTFVYIGKRYVKKVINGKQKEVLESLIPNLLFAYTTKEKAQEYIKTPALSFLSFYYNHFRIDSHQKNPPLTISCQEMENFILATCNQNEHLLFVVEQRCHFKGGETVRVTDGMFKGVTGRVARVAGQQRVVLSLSEIGLISTAYIPKAFIQVIESD